VAEGVENQWTLDLLASFGCDQAQGFHIARPMPAAAFAGWLGGSPWRVLAS
jgi:EAL domain-containing protein (putative c-di-GMP-specific phosphodiesterase class I)